LSNKYLVAIPVFNEAGSVARVLTRTRQFARDILVIDDGSTDDTPAILERFDTIHAIRHPTNFGYGQSLIDAFGYAGAHRYEWLITMDCDEQHEPAAIPMFVEAMTDADADIISGSRYLTAHPGDDAPPEDRRSINQRITRMLNERLGLTLTDAFCGFKAHRVAALRRLRLSETGYAFPMQLWAQVARWGLRVRERPVRLVYHDPNRHFGGDLDNPTVRYDHYREVFEREMAALDQAGVPAAAGRANSCGGSLPSCCPG
jgi:glycosyltransferase involved in cell wall biosynthesis